MDHLVRTWILGVILCVATGGSFEAWKTQKGNQLKDA